MTDLKTNLNEEADKKGLTGEARHNYIGGTIHNIEKNKGKTPKQRKHATSQTSPVDTSEKRFNELKHKLNFGAISKEEYAEYEKIAPHWIQEHNKRIANDPYYYVVVTYKKKARGTGTIKQEHSFTEKSLAESDAKRQRAYVPLLYEKVEVETRLKKKHK